MSQPRTSPRTSKPRSPSLSGPRRLGFAPGVTTVEQVTAHSEVAAIALEPVDLAAHIDNIELYLGQVCRLAGISKMQLDYWTNKAQIPTKGRKQRIYDMDAIETVLLIKQGKDKGLNLAAAIDAARRFREERALPVAD